MEKKRHKIESNKFSNHPKLGAKIPDPYTYCFIKCGKEERERVLSFPNHPKLGDKNTTPIYCFKVWMEKKRDPK
jgi:hypothetical protein